jgi:Domain of unknown function (DUF4177)
MTEELDFSEIEHTISGAAAWEYHIERFATDSPAEEEMLRDPQRLNALGAAGWELANIVWRPKTEEGWRRDWGQALVFCIFKRRVANPKSKEQPLDDD